MYFDLPEHLPPLLEHMDAFIEAEIVPLQAQYPQFPDERREFARTDLDRGVYRFKTQCTGYELRLLSVGELRHDRGSCPCACCT